MSVALFYHSTISIWFNPCCISRIRLVIRCFTVDREFNFVTEPLLNNGFLVEIVHPSSKSEFRAYSSRPVVLTAPRKNFSNYLPFTGKKELVVCTNLAKNLR